MSPRHESTIGATRISLIRGDITEQRVQAIVNAANTSLLGGGGVDGAIHRRGGPAIITECRTLRAQRFPNGLPTGDAVATTAGQLAAERVIHTVGPIWHGGGQGESVLLAKAYRNSLECARLANLRTIAFPSISTGAYGYPIQQAAQVALRTVTDWLLEQPDALDEVRFVLFSAADHQTYSEALEKVVS